MPARAGIRSKYQLESPREMRDGVRSVNADGARFKRLAQGVEHAGLKFRSLIEEKDPVGGSCR
jgi:hypothetical protein